MPRCNAHDRRTMDASQTTPPDAAVLSLEEINGLTYRQAVRHLRVQKLHARHLKTVEDMRDFLRCLYHPASCSESDNTEMLNDFKIQTEQFRAQQSQLADICARVEQEFADKTNPRIADIEKDIAAGLSKNWKANLRNLQKRLRSHKTPVLVAGESGSGKSSLINLLINQELLPEADHPCTAAICLIKDCERTFVELRRSKTDRQEIDVTDHEMWRQFLTDRSGLESHDKDSVCNRRVVFHTPLPQFQEGTYLVDSPGFREGPLLTEVLLKYMPKASAFVIVLMTDNYGGLNESVKEFITGIRRTLNDISLKAMDNDIEPGSVSSLTVNSVVFVFNRWDIVVREETAERAKKIRSDCLAKLRELWPVVNEEQNVFFMSVAKNFTKISQNVAPDVNFVKLKTAIYSLIPKSHESRVTTAYMWLEQLARKISSNARNQINIAKLSEEDKTKQLQRLNNMLEHAQEVGQSLLDELNNTIDARQEKFIDELMKHLQSEEALQRMCAFGEDEKVYGESPLEVDFLPDPSSYSRLRAELEPFCLRRVWREAKFWNETPAWSFDAKSGEHQLHSELTRFATFAAELRRLIVAMVAETDAEARMLRTVLDQEDAEAVVASQASDDHDVDLQVQFSPKEKAVLGVTAVIWVPLGVIATVLALPVVAGLFARQRIKNNEILRTYRKNKAGCMTRVLTNFVRSGLTEEVLRQMMDFHIKVSTFKAQAEKYFPSVIEEFQARIERLTEDRRSEAEILDAFTPIVTDACQILSHLYNFAAQHFRLFPFREDHFLDLRSATAPHRSGFSDDFCFTVPANWRNFDRPTVSVKIVRAPISSGNAYRIFKEEQAWRKLGKYNKPNIVQFHGLVSFGSPKQVGFVMELCEQNLADLVRSTPAVVPSGWPQGSVKKSEAFHRAAAMGLQIATALSFIHQHYYIHRNLRMETVSVFRDGLTLTLKLSDFGLSRAGGDITTTMTGALVYLSPEVLNQFGCSAASDVYALGLLLWELYHGQRVFSWLPARDRSIKVFQDLYRSGKMALLFQDDAIPAEYRSVVESCTHLQADKRPQTNQVCDLLKKMTPCGKDRVQLPNEELM